MKFKKIGITAFLSTLFLVSCSKDAIEPTKYVPLGSYDSGVLVLNQGSFTNATSVSYISFDLNTLQNDIFSIVNAPLTLGILGQDIGFNEDLAYIVLSGANKIQIVNRYTMVNVGSIDTGLSHPRYIVFSNGKGYITNQADFADLSDDYVTVFNATTNAIITTIPLAGGSAEKMLVDSGKIYVAQGGEYGTGNAIKVINTSSDLVTNTITVGDSPNSLQIDNGFLWVLCGGNSQYYPAPTPATATAGRLVKIDLATASVAKNFYFGDVSLYPKNFTVLNGKGYYTVNKDIYSMALTDDALPIASKFATTAENLNAFAIKNNYIYIADALNFNSDGKVYIYSLGEATGSNDIGTLEMTHTVGIGPCGFYFNQ